MSKKFVLFSLLVVLMLTASFTCRPVDRKAMIDDITKQDREQLIESVQSLVRIKSVEGNPEAGAPFGKGPAEALNKALSIAEDLGFETVNMDGYVGYVEYGEGDDYVAVLTHLDVVPEGEGWTYPPYSGEIHDNRIYGRGTVDDKGPAMASLFALKAVRDAGIPLSKRVRLIFGTNEETEVQDVPHYLLSEKPPVAGFSPDGFFPVIFAEKGRLQLNLVKGLDRQTSTTVIENIQGGTAINSVPEFARAEISTPDADALIGICRDFADSSGYHITAEKTGDGIIIKSLGKAAHASMPESGQNAIMQLLTVLEVCDTGKSDISDIISFMVDRIGSETNGILLGIAMNDEVSGDLTVNVGTIEMAENKVTFGIDIRYPVTFSAEQVLAKLEQAIQATGLNIEVTIDEEPLYYPADSPMVKTMLDIYREQTGRQDSPIAIGGASYARDMPNILCFGPVFSDEIYPGHMPDEYIDIDHLLLNTKIYANAIYKLATDDN